MSLKYCQKTLGQLYDEAYVIDPHRAEILKELWEGSDFTNRDLAIGL